MRNQQKLEGVKHQPTISQSKTDHVSQMTQPWWHAVEGCSEFRPFKHMNHSLSSRKKVIRRIYSEEFLRGSHWEAGWNRLHIISHISLKNCFVVVDDVYITISRFSMVHPRDPRVAGRQRAPHGSLRDDTGAWAASGGSSIRFMGQWIGLRENFNRKAPYLMGKSMVSCKFSLKPIHWMGLPEMDGGSPIAGWFMESKPTINGWFFLGYSHDLGHLGKISELNGFFFLQTMAVIPKSNVVLLFVISHYVTLLMDIATVIPMRPINHYSKDVWKSNFRHMDSCNDYYNVCIMYIYIYMIYVLYYISWKTIKTKSSVRTGLDIFFCPLRFFLQIRPCPAANPLLTGQ